MGYKVELKPSGHCFEVKDGQHVLDAGLEAGFAMPYSCRNGACATCRGRILSGTVDYSKYNPAHLSDEQRAEGLSLLCKALPLSDLVVEVRELSLVGIKPRTVPCRVVEIEMPAADVAVLTLKLPLQENLRFASGQYIDLLLSNGVRRSYSIAQECPPEGVSKIQLHIRHSPGGLFTDQLFGGRITIGQVLQFEAPLGTFYLREDSNAPIIMLASGTGFAPLKAICEHAFRYNVEKSRPIVLYWGCRKPADLYMAELPERWSREFPGFTFVPVISEPTPQWRGRTGFVHRAVMADHADLSDYQVYACGTPAMVNAARTDFIAQRRLHEDNFIADPFFTAAELSEPLRSDSDVGGTLKVGGLEVAGLIEVKNGNSIVKPYVMSHGTMQCRNLQATRKFYEEFLGLECARHSRSSIAVRCGMRFHIACVEVGDQMEDVHRHHHWGIDVRSNEEVDFAYRKAVELTEKYRITKILPPALNRGVYSFFIKDLDGNWWEIQHYDGFQHDDIFDFGDRVPMSVSDLAGSATAGSEGYPEKTVEPHE